jgi:hypothetical protein
MFSRKAKVLRYDLTCDMRDIHSIILFLRKHLISYYKTCQKSELTLQGLLLLFLNFDTIWRKFRQLKCFIFIRSLVSEVFQHFLEASSNPQWQVSSFPRLRFRYLHDCLKSGARTFRSFAVPSFTLKIWQKRTIPLCIRPLLFHFT